MNKRVDIKTVNLTTEEKVVVDAAIRDLKNPNTRFNVRHASVIELDLPGEVVSWLEKSAERFGVSVDELIRAILISELLEKDGEG